MRVYLNFIPLIIGGLLGIGIEWFSQTPTLLAQNPISLLEQYGPMAIIVGFFIWWSWLRENRMSKQNDALEEYIKDKLITTVTDTNDTITNNTKALECVSSTMEEIKDSNGKLTGIIENAPCLLVSAARKQINVEEKDGSIIITPHDTI